MRISAGMANLLQAAGIRDVQQLARLTPDDLLDLLHEANVKATEPVTLPTRIKAQLWIECAREQLAATPRSSRDQTATTAASPRTKRWVNWEENPELAAFIGSAPVALPLPGRLLMDKGLSVSEIPAAALLNNAPIDQVMRLTSRHAERSPSRVNSGSAVQSISFQSSRQDVAREKVRSTQEFLKNAPVIPASKGELKGKKASAEENEDGQAPESHFDDERVRLLRAPREETNRGRDPRSRWYIRGVLHPSPAQVWLGGLFVMICQLLIPIGLISAILLLLLDQHPQSYSWVPRWLLIFPTSLPIFGMLYLLTGFHARCRICGQKCYVPRNCLKNKKAHHLPFLGYIFSVALHAVLFRWFRCTYCGTPVRLKE